MKILNYGSLNLDYVYTVPHFVQPGETLDVSSREIKFGGKGLNQSVALARAGVRVYHAGAIGTGGEPLVEYLRNNGVNTENIIPVGEMQGHTVIQVNRLGENCILLFGGSNRCQDAAAIPRTVSAFDPGDWLLLQNEINLLPEIVDTASVRGMNIVLNPSPFNEALREVDFRKLSWLFVNEIEAEQITGEREPQRIWSCIHERWPSLSVLVTLGENGSAAFRVRGNETEMEQQPAEPAEAVDTTGAGDTYTGYFIAGLMEGCSLKKTMERASHAAAISVTRPGAAESIPYRDE